MRIIVPYGEIFLEEREEKIVYFFELSKIEVNSIFTA